MTVQQNADFFSPTTICFGTLCFTQGIPWVSSFNDVGGPAAVLHENLGNFDAGMYAYMPATQEWRIVIPYTDICAYIADSYSVELQLDLQSSQSFPAGTILYKNGTLLTGTSIAPEEGALFAIVVPSAGGGGGGGGNASLTYANLPGGLPVPAPTDPVVTLNNGAVPASNMKFVELKSVGGASLGLTLVNVT